MIKLNYQAL